MYPLLRPFVRGQLRKSIQILQVRNAVRLKIIKPVCKTGAEPETYFEKNKRFGRKLSPSLSIYAPQMTTLLSVTHRATGMILCGYAYLLGLFALVAPHDMCHYITMYEGLGLSPYLILPMKFCLALPFAYHYMNGIRHLIWDSANMLRRRHIYSSGYAMLVASLILGGILTIL